MPKRRTTTKRPTTKLPTPNMASRSMISVFGWREAEIAAMRICAKARKANSWDVFVSPGEFHDDDMAKEGVEFLKGRGFLEYHLDRIQGYDIGLWTVTTRFIRRVCSRRARRIDKGAR